MNKLMRFVVLVMGCAFAGSAFAASHVDEVWTCKLNEGKEIEAVHAANSEWVKHVNGATDVGEVSSATAESIVGDQEIFYFVDRYPSLAAYAAVKEYLDSDTGKAAMEAIESNFEDIFDCTSNRLYKFTPN